MVGQLIRLKIKEGTQATFEPLVAQLMRDVSSHEPGAIYEVRRVQGEPLTYVYFISFPDQAAYDRYVEAEYHTSMSPKALALLDGDPVFEELEVLSA